MESIIYKTKKERVQEFRDFMSGAFQGAYCDHLTEQFDALGFFDAPASTKYHGAYAGGLCDHSLDVGRNLVLLTEKLDLAWTRKRSPYLVGVGHDLCKCDQYIRQTDGSFHYADNLPLTGHGDKSVMLLQQLIDLTEEEMLCIRWHMGGYDDSKHWNHIGAAIEKYQTVLWTHTADMMASRVHGV